MVICKFILEFWVTIEIQPAGVGLAGDLVLAPGIATSLRYHITGQIFQGFVGQDGILSCTPMYL
jgi:hypothetical protein